eukprot:7576586-Pyramimonas_sp.AAC.1
MGVTNTHALRSACATQLHHAWGVPSRSERGGNRGPARVARAGSGKHSPHGAVRHRLSINCFTAKGSTKVLRRARLGGGLSRLDRGEVLAEGSGKPGASGFFAGLASRHVCRVTSPANESVPGSSADRELNGAELNGAELNGDDDVLDMMQSVSGTLQRKMETMRTRLEEAVEARNKLEV